MAEIYSSSLAYLAVAENQIEGGAPAFIVGEFEALYGSTLAHIVAEPIPGEDPSNSCRETLLLFIDGEPLAGAPSITGTQSLHMDGGGFPSTKLAYLVATTFENESMSAFIEGTDQSGLKEAIRFESIFQQYVQINDITQYDFLNKFTLNLYVRPRTDSDGRYQGIFVKEGVIETWVHPSGNSFGMRANIGGVWYQALTLSFTKDKWHMLTVKHDGSGVHFYMNGVEFNGTTAPGELTSNNAPIYFGRYPSKGTYSDIDMCDVQLWNYDLTNSEVAALYIPQSRRSCMEMYLCVNDMTASSSIKRSYLVSAPETTNPLTITSSQSAGFAEQSVYGAVQAYLVAGGEATSTFDTRFITDNKTYMSWDNIIMVQGNQTRITEIQLGSVVYPITREARRMVRIPTSYDPLTDYTTTRAFIVASVDLVASRSAHVVGVNAVSNVKFVHISGGFTSLSDSMGAFIVNNELASTTACYINGLNIFRYDWTQPAFVLGYSDNQTGATDVFTNGHVSWTGSKQAYIATPLESASIKRAYITSTSFDLASSRFSFLRGNVGIIRDTDAFIYGHFSNSGGQPSYIQAIAVSISGVGCFVQAASPYRATERAYVRSHDVVEPTVLLYLKAEVNEQGFKPAYIGGINSQFRATRLHLNGPTTIPLSDSVSGFVVNTDPISTKYAFIVSGPLTSVSCYIISSGSSGRVKSAYIEA